MVRDAQKRLKKYEDKVDPEVLKKQTEALKPGMVRAQGAYFPQITTVEQRIKALVEAQGVSTLQVRDYLNYGRELYELTSKFSGQTLNSEAQNRLNKWTARGLDGATLYHIAKLFGLAPSYTPTPPPVLSLNDLTDVEIAAPSNNQLLKYETATSLWKNKAPGLQFHIPYNGKIADIHESDVLHHYLDLATALSETRKIIAIILDGRRMSGTGNLYYYANEGAQATIDYLTGRARLVIIKDASYRLEYSQSVSNDDFDLYSMGYIVEA
jgi:hypothetical protein